MLVNYRPSTDDVLKSVLLTEELHKSRGRMNALLITFLPVFRDYGSDAKNYKMDYLLYSTGTTIKEQICLVLVLVCYRCFHVDIKALSSRFLLCLTSRKQLLLSYLFEGSLVGSEIIALNVQTFSKPFDHIVQYIDLSFFGVIRLCDPSGKTQSAITARAFFNNKNYSLPYCLLNVTPSVASLTK